MHLTSFHVEFIDNAAAPNLLGIPHRIKCCDDRFAIPQLEILKKTFRFGLLGYAGHLFLIPSMPFFISFFHTKMVLLTNFNLFVVNILQLKLKTPLPMVPTTPWHLLGEGSYYFKFFFSMFQIISCVSSKNFVLQPSTALVMVELRGTRCNIGGVLLVLVLRRYLGKLLGILVWIFSSEKGFHGFSILQSIQLPL